jgi:NAD(P)-dependent dehydrogenase (short-subunit alcohol dehydrogenase family)
MSTVLITGCDRAIGRAMCLQLQERGDRVVAVYLGDPQDLRDRGLRVEPHIDVTQDDAVNALAGRLEADDVRLDWLISNAGVLGVDELGKIDFDDVRRQFEINAIGPLHVVQALAGRLQAGSKVGILTSRVGSLEDNTTGGMYAYRASKAAANMVGLNLHHDFKDRGIAVLMLHPGLVATDLTKDFPRDMPWIEPEEAATGLIRNIDELSLETEGRFCHSNGEYLPW